MRSRADRRGALTALSVLMALDVVLFLGAAIVHLGIPLSLGPVSLTLGQIIPATIVEGLIGLLAVASLTALLEGKSWFWDLALGTHLVGLAGVSVGLAFVTSSSGPHQTVNVAIHVAMLAVLVMGVVLLVTIRRPALSASI